MVINAEYVSFCCFNALARSADSVTAKKKSEGSSVITVKQDNVLRRLIILLFRV